MDDAGRRSASTARGCQRNNGSWQSQRELRRTERRWRSASEVGQAVAAEDEVDRVYCRGDIGDLHCTLAVRANGDIDGTADIGRAQRREQCCTPGLPTREASWAVLL